MIVDVLQVNVRHGGYVPKDRAVLRELLGIDWVTTEKGLFESLPPAYTEHIGTQLMQTVTVS